MKVLTILGTRPEIIKLSRTISLLDKFVNHVIVHTGQNYDYELNQVFFEDLGIRKPNHFLNVAEDGLGGTISNIIKNSDEIFNIEKPDALLVLGDTNSCLSTIMAKRRKIPIFHMEAGNRCFDLRVPEEINRKLVDHISDINFPYSEHAKLNLINEGIHPSTIIKTGSPMKEVLAFSASSIKKSKILDLLGLKKNQYFLASIHREENVDSVKKLKQIISSLDEVIKKYNLDIILSLHPRTKKIISSEKIKLNKKIIQCNPFGFNDYIKLQENAYCVISDSGTIFEESSIVGFPAITIREATERPEGIDEGTVVMCNGFEKKIIIKSIDVSVAQYEANPPSTPFDYNVNQVSWKVLKSILSYKEFVNKKTWYKS
jgi:UDP-N-acetylglucosamine 2-epimerase